MKRKYFFTIIFHSLITLLLTNCKTVDPEKEKQAIEAMLDSLNADAAKAKFENYFNHYTEDAIFIGTDASEYWNKKDFMTYSKPYFDKGKAWSFKALERHIYFDNTGTLAWFDELLNTQMKICRGSGVVVKQGNEWKLKQYVLSMTIPNAKADSVIKIKSPMEDDMIKLLEQKK